MIPQLNLYWYPSQIFWILVSFTTLFLYVQFYFAPYIERILSKRIKERSLINSQVAKLSVKINTMQEEMQNKLNEVNESYTDHQKRIKEELKMQFDQDFILMKQKFEIELNKIKSESNAWIKGSVEELRKSLPSLAISLKENLMSNDKEKKNINLANIQKDSVC